MGNRAARERRADRGGHPRRGLRDSDGAGWRGVYDAGQVAPNRSALSLRDFERDYGVGLRIGTDLGVFIRLDIAFGSSEGTKNVAALQPRVLNHEVHL